MQIEVGGQKFDVSWLKDAPIGFWADLEDAGLLDQNGQLDIQGITNGLKFLHTVLVQTDKAVTLDWLRGIPGSQWASILPQLADAMAGEAREDVRPTSDNSSTPSTVSALPTGGELTRSAG